MYSVGLVRPNADRHATELDGHASPEPRLPSDQRRRLLFPKANTTQALWLSSKGGRLGDDALYDVICRRTKQAFGFAIHPHLFRDIAATAIAREAPGSLAVARDLLTHAKFETTQQYYTQARTADAARTHAEVLARLRAAPPRRKT